MPFKDQQFIPLGDIEPPAWLAPELLSQATMREGVPFSEAEYRRRHTALVACIQQVDAAVGLVFRPSSVDWLCGFRSTALIPMPAIVDPESIGVVLPDVEAGRAIAGSCADEVLYAHPTADRIVLLSEHLRARFGSGARVAVSFGCPYTPANLAAALRAVGLEPVEGGGMAEDIRLILSAEEVAQVDAAAAQTKRGLDAAVQAVRDGAQTDSQVASALVGALVDGSNSLVRGEVVVATGWRGGITHSTWNGSPLRSGTTTLLEFTGASNYYVAPIMRTLAHGPLGKRADRLAGLAELAVEATIAELRPGAIAADIARSVIKQMGQLEDWVVFHFNFGYPIGIAHGRTWMDGAQFYLRDDNEQPLQPGMTFHLPGTMRGFGELAVAASHTVTVTEDGARVISEAMGSPTPIHV